MTYDTRKPGALFQREPPLNPRRSDVDRISLVSRGRTGLFDSVPEGLEYSVCRIKKIREVGSVHILYLDNPSFGSIPVGDELPKGVTEGSCLTVYYTRHTDQIVCLAPRTEDKYQKATK